MAVTALQIITSALTNLNVFQIGQSLPGPQSADGFARLNRMVGQWAQQSLTIPAVSREVFALVSGKGGPSNVYTVGTGGDFNTDRPPSVSSITGVGLLMNSSSPAVEIPRALYTDDQYAAVAVKELASAQFTGVYYNPTFAGALGTINLWPVPNVTTNSLVLYRRRQVAQFADLSATAYDFPPGYEEALIYQLEFRLAGPHGRTVPDEDRRLGTAAFDTVCHSNVKVSDMRNDITTGRGGRYWIQSGGMV